MEVQLSKFHYNFGNLPERKDEGDSAHPPAAASRLPAPPSGVGLLSFRGRNSLVLTIEGSKRKKLLLEGEDVCLLTKPISTWLPLGHRTRVPQADAGTSNIRL